MSRPFIPAGPPRFRASSALESFIMNTSVERNCWRWTGDAREDGYGIIWDKKPQYAHRWSYEAFVGPIPKGLVIDHSCNNKWCVKPAHLRPMTSGDNIARAFEERCRNGHVRTATNTKVGPRGRRCLECSRIADRKRGSGWSRAKNKEQK